MNKRIYQLKKYLKKEDWIVMAFLFGSRLKKMFRQTSDWDIGIYLKKNYQSEIIDEIWAKVEEILGKEVDLVILNEAPPLLASRIIREGFPLVIKDRREFLDFLLEITEEAEFFREFSDDYYQIYQRSKSLSETDRVRLERILIFLENELRDFPNFKKLTFEEYNRNISKQREVERWIEKIMNSTIDVAKIILASKREPLPETYRKIVEQLSLLPNLKFIKVIASWVKLRNILAHEYLDIRWKEIKDFLDNGEAYFKKFLLKVKEILKNKN